MSLPRSSEPPPQQPHSQPFGKQTARYQSKLAAPALTIASKLATARQVAAKLPPSN